MKKNLKPTNYKLKKKEKTGSMSTGEAVKMLIAKVWDHKVNVFADIGLKIISLIILKLEKYIAKLIRMERNASANCLIIFPYLARKI